MSSSPATLARLLSMDRRTGRPADGPRRDQRRPAAAPFVAGATSTATGSTAAAGNAPRPRDAPRRTPCSSGRRIPITPA